MVRRAIVQNILFDRFTTKKNTCEMMKQEVQQRKKELEVIDRGVDKNRRE